MGNIEGEQKLHTVVLKLGENRTDLKHSKKCLFGFITNETNVLYSF